MLYLGSVELFHPHFMNLWARQKPRTKISSRGDESQKNINSL